MTGHKQDTLSVSSFHMPMRFMRAHKRYAMHVLYEFCRAADDAVDAGVSPQESLVHLTQLREMIFSLYVTPEKQSNPPLAATIHTFDLKRDYFDAILDGMEMDAKGQMLRPSLATLTLYCYRVASSVGLLSIAIFGSDELDAAAFSIALGHALQLTNILRDLKEDAARERLYLPLEWLKEEGIGSIAPAQLVNYPEAVQKVCEKLGSRALHYFAEAELLSHHCNRRKLLPALLMRDVYFAYLRKLMKQNNYLQAHSLRFSFLQKLGFVARAIRYM